MITFIDKEISEEEARKELLSNESVLVKSNKLRALEEYYNANFKKNPSSVLEVLLSNNILKEMYRLTLNELIELNKTRYSSNHYLALAIVAIYICERTSDKYAYKILRGLFEEPDLNYIDIHRRLNFRFPSLLSYFYSLENCILNIDRVTGRYESSINYRGNEYSDWY